MFKRLSRFLVWLIAILWLFSTAGCGLCGCDKSEADAITLAIASAAAGQPVNKATLDIDTHLFGADEFTLTIQIPNKPPIVSKGEFSTSGNSATFKVTNGVSALIFPGVYELTCKERDGKKFVVLRQKNPVGQPLTFECH